MLQYPYGVYPNGNTIDTSVPFVFSMFVSGTSCVAYKLTILENVSGKSFYDGTKVILPQPIYNQEMLEITNNQPIQTGREYIYNYTLWTERADIPVTTGVIVETLGESTLVIGQYNLIQKDQTITINGESAKIQNYTWDSELNRGMLVLSSALSSIPQTGDSFKITSDFIETPYYYFNAQNTPVLEFANIPPIVANRKFDFIGEYTQSQFAPIQKYNYKLYVKQNGEDVLIDETFDIYNTKLTYSYDGFINGNTYKILLQTTNQNNIQNSIGREFNVAYSEPITTGQMSAVFNYDNHSAILTITSTDSDILYWDLYRREVDSAIQTKIGRAYVDNKSFEDFGITNKKTYSWFAIPVTTNFTAQAIQSNNLTTNWGDWSICSLTKNGNEYIANQIVKLNLNLESADMTQNTDIVYHTNYTRYPKASQGVLNYLSGNISCLLGKIKSIKSVFYSEEDFTITQWRDFVNNGEPKLLKDRAGNKYLVSISNSSSNVDDASMQQLNTINFDFTEIGDASKLIIYGQSAGFKSEFTMKQSSGDLIVVYEQEEYPYFQITNEYLIVSYDEDNPINLHINAEGDLIETAF